MTAQDAELDVAALFVRYRLGLIRLAILLVDDRQSAEDVVQSVFTKLWRLRAEVRAPGSMDAYLRRAVVNESRSALRRRRTVRQHLTLTRPPDSETPDEPILVAEEHRAVLAMVCDLPPRQREVLVLRYWSNLSEAEIAETMGVSRGTVKSQASRALATLEAKMGGVR